MSATTAAASSSEGWMNDMQNMEKVIAIYEQLGGKNEPQIQDLVTLYRRWVRTEDQILVREAPFSASPKVPHVLFLFRDVLLLGKRAGSSSSSNADTRKSMVLNIFSSAGGGRRRGSSAESTPNAPPPPASSSSSELKLSHYIPLSECNFKPLPPANGVESGIQLTRVSRLKQLYTDGKTWQTVTRVEKTELWLPGGVEQRDALLDELNQLQRARSEEEEEGGDEEEDDARTYVSEDAEDDVGEEGKRQPASKEPIRVRSWAKNLRRTARANSDESALSSTTTSDQLNPLSLEDLALRYNVDFAQVAEMKNVEEFTIEFGEGQMGFSLSSSPEVGVVVGKLSMGGFAQLGGCEIGDRLDTVNGIQVDMDTTWQRAVDMIKACGRPVTLKFVRNVALLNKVQEEQQKQQEAAVPAAPANKGTRKWASRKQRGTSESALQGLRDLEKMYQSLETTTSSTTGREAESGSVVGGEEDEDEDGLSIHLGAGREAQVLHDFASQCENEHERACVAVLMEILQTERDFVSSLRALVKEYVLPVRRATRRRKCRELDTSALMCEHGSLRSKCGKTSTTSGPLLTTQDISKIFMNLETIIHINAELLHSMETGLRECAPKLGAEGITVQEGLPILVSVFSQSFDKIKPFFSMYALYCHQYPAAVARLQQLRNEDEDVDACIRDREAMSKHTSLRSLLIKPVQRICRYPMLFHELLKRAGKALVDKTILLHIQQTAEDADRIAQDVNRGVEARESVGNIMSAYHELGGENGGEQVRNHLVVPSRRFIRKEDVFYREPPFEEHEIESRRMYVFNDLVIIAQQRETAASAAAAATSAIAAATTGRLSVSSRARPLSIKKSLSNLFGAASSSDAAAASNPSSSTSPAPTDAPAMGMFEVVNWIDLTSAAEAKPLPKPDDLGYYGFRFKSVKRTTTQEQASETTTASLTKKITWAPNVVSNTSSTTTRVITLITKVEIWMNSRDKLQSLIASIEDQIGQLELLQQNAKLGALAHGQKQTTRSWIKKKNSGEDLGMGGASSALSGNGGTVRKSMANSVDGKVDAKEALAQLSKKYSTKRMTASSNATDTTVMAGE